MKTLTQRQLTQISQWCGHYDAFDVYDLWQWLGFDPEDDRQEALREQAIAAIISCGFGLERLRGSVLLFAVRLSVELALDPGHRITTMI